MFVLANGQQIQKHFKFLRDALQDYKDTDKS